MQENKKYIWTEVYQPQTLEEVIIPEAVKTQFRSFITNKQIPNLLLTSSSPGTGKSVSAKALCNELGIKYLFLNASLNNSVDDIRTTVMQYATTMTMFDSPCSHKVVIFDEACRLSPASMDAMKGICDSVISNCRFIFTANNKHKIIEPLQSRCTNIDFVFNKEESAKLVLQMYKRCCFILDEQKVEYSKPALAGIVKNFSPDNRRLLLFLQNEAACGKIDEGTLAKAASVMPEALVLAMKDKKFKDVSQWIADNADGLQEDFYDKLFRLLEPVLVDQSIPEVILVLGDYQRFDSVVPSKNIHYLSLCIQIMMSAEFKK
jgi:DNA polymerase III delta prime subunit